MTSMSQATVSLSGITTPAMVENRELEMLIIASIKTLKQGNKQEKITNMWRWGTLQNFLAINWWTLKNPKNQTFKKMKRIAGDIIILHMCTKNTIIWGTVSEIWSVTKLFVILGHFLPCYPDMECDRNNCHFRQFFALLPHYWPRKLKFQKNVKKSCIYVLSFYTCIYQKSRSYDEWFLRYEV